MKRLTEKLIFRIVVFLLVGVVLAVCLYFLFPTHNEQDLEYTTVTLRSFRYETVGAVPKRYGSSDIKALIYTASDGEEYQIIMPYKKEAEEWKGQTVELGFVRDGSSYVGAHMAVELSRDGIPQYTLENWNSFQENRRAVLFWVWFGVSILFFIPTILEILECFGIIRRRRRHRKNRAAHLAQIQNLENRPRNFPQTVWRTEDGSLTLTVSSDGVVTGTIRHRKGESVTSIPVLFDDTAHTTIRMAEIKGGKPKTPYVEIWEADYHSPDEFDAKPQKTTYFKKGKTVTLRRTDGERSESDP